MLKPTPNFPVLNGSSDLLNEKTHRQLVDTSPECVSVTAHRTTTPPPNSQHLLRSSVLMCSKSLSVNTASLPMTRDGHCKRRTLTRRDIRQGFGVVGKQALGIMALHLGCNSWSVEWQRRSRQQKNDSAPASSAGSLGGETSVLVRENRKPATKPECGRTCILNEL